MSPAAPNSPAAKKAKRQKQIIAVGSVILLALLGYELPKTLHHAATASAVTTAPPSVVGSPPAVPVGQLPDTDRVVVQHDSDQLLSFGLFKSKDPFVQQLSTIASVPAAPPAPAAPKPKAKPASPPRVGVGLTPVMPTAPVTTTTPTTPSGSSSPPAGPGPAVTTTSGSPGTTPGTTTPVAPATAPADALITTNGVCERVALKGTFPANEDIFRLVSIAPDRKSVEIGVVGGSYDSGQATATLKLGDKLTLVNTADGTRYVIVLQSKCAVVAQPAPPTSTASVTTTPVATPPPTTTTATATTTSPIVTDSFDTPVPPSN